MGWQEQLSCPAETGVLEGPSHGVQATSAQVTEGVRGRTAKGSKLSTKMERGKDGRSASGVLWAAVARSSQPKFLTLQCWHRTPHGSRWEAAPDQTSCPRLSLDGAVPFK